MPAEGRENPLLKKGNSDAFFREKYLTKNRPDFPSFAELIGGIIVMGGIQAKIPDRDIWIESPEFF